MSSTNSFKKFMFLWGGELISSIGGGLTAFGLGVYVFEQTQNASSVALITLLAFLPTILLSVPAGILADRFDRRTLMMLGDGLSGIGVLYILISILSGKGTLMNICIGVTISSIFSSLLGPSFKATISDLLTEEEFSKASGLVQLSNSAKFLFSPLIAGFLLIVTGVETLLIIDICTFIVTVLVTFVVKKGIITEKRESNNSIMTDLKEGLAEIIDNKGIFSLVILMSFVSFCMGFVQTLYTPMILSFSNSKVLGVIETASAVGTLLASLLIGIVAIKRDYIKVLSRALLCAGIFMAVMGLREDLRFIGVGGFMLFATFPFISMSADCLIRTNIDNTVQGRVWGFVSIISQMGYVVAYAISGVLADYIFEPMLREDGILEHTIGSIIGVGQGRGIALLLIIAGFILCIVAIAFAVAKSVKALEGERCID